MAVSVSQVNQYVTGNKRVVVNNITLDSSFASGGEPLTKAQLGLSQHVYSVATIKTVGSDTVNVTSAAYDGATELLHVYDETPAEVSGDVSDVVIQLVSHGR